jgi:hypothetical protein
MLIARHVEIGCNFVATETKPHRLNTVYDLGLFTRKHKHINNFCLKAHFLTTFKIIRGLVFILLLLK